MSSPFTLNSDKLFIQAFDTGYAVGICVYEYGGDPQNVSDTILSSRWNFAHSINVRIMSKTLEVYGVKFDSSTDQFDSLMSDLTLTSKDESRTIELRVNRNGVCFVKASEKEWVRTNDDVFSWAKHGVKAPPRGREIWSVLGRVNGAVSEELLSLRERSQKLMEESDKLKDETESFLKRSLEEKEKEAASLKTVWEEKEEEVTSIKVALNALMDK